MADQETKDSSTADNTIDEQHSNFGIFQELMPDLRGNALYGLILAIVIIILERYFLPATDVSTITAVASFIIAAGILLAYLTWRRTPAQRYKLLLAGIILYMFIGAVAGAFLFSEERTGILILDVSEHMKGRFDEVVSYVEDTRFADELDYVGMMTFGGGLSFTLGCNDIAIQVEPSSRQDGEPRIEQRLRNLADTVPAGPETVQTAVLRTIELLAGRKGYHKIILVTSGTLGNSCDPLVREYLNDRAQALGVDFDLTIIALDSLSDDNKSRLEGFANGQVSVVSVAEIPKAVESALIRPRFSLYSFLY